MSKQPDPRLMIDALTKAYAMELETVGNYLASSVNLDGVLAQEVKETLAQDVDEELGHARKLAARIKQLGGRVPLVSELSQGSAMEPMVDSTDVETVLRSAIEDELAAIANYRAIIHRADGSDYVTQDLCIKLLADEEAHRTQLEAFLKEYVAPAVEAVS